MFVKFIFKHGTVNNVDGGFISGGISSNSQSNVIRAYSSQPNGYANYWFNDDFLFGSNTFASGNQVSITYDGSYQRGYINGKLNYTLTHSGGTTASGQQYLFRTPGGEYLNGQIYNALIFNKAIPVTDVAILSSNNQQSYPTNNNY